MVVYEKIYFEAYTNDWHNNNIAQLYFILRTAKLHWNFSSITKDAPDIYRFSNRKWILTMCTTGIRTFDPNLFSRYRTEALSTF